ncbi:MAG: aminopeptidase, partial [Rhizobiales bacterium]|nr:aminopeptidase [Hyphomicrobiales bacterium]
MKKRALLTACAALAVIAGFVCLPIAAEAGGSRDDSAKLRKKVTLSGIRAHQKAFQAAADANNGTRASGTGGYDASAAYVKRKLKRAGYVVTEQPFD